MASYLTNLHGITCLLHTRSLTTVPQKQQAKYKEVAGKAFGPPPKEKKEKKQPQQEQATSAKNAEKNAAKVSTYPSDFS